MTAGQEIPTTKARLREFMAAHPNACAELTLEQIGKELGVTRERVRQLMPDYAKRRRPVVRSRRVGALLAYIEAHPEASLTPGLGGMTLKAIGAELGCSAETVSNVWREAGLPDRKILAAHKTWKERYHEDPERRRKARVHAKKWQAANPEKFRAMQKRYNRARRARQLAKVLRQEVCAWCGKTFDWTAHHERTFKHVTCGPLCAIRVGRWRKWG